MSSLPHLPLGRLFWKFLIFFFLAQVTTVFGIGLAIWATHPDFVGAPPLPQGASFAAAPTDRRPPPPGFNPGETRRLPPPGAAKIPTVHLMAGAVVSLIFAALLAAYVSRPIRRLRQAMQAAANGELAPGLSAAMGKRRDELADLGRDFDRMAQHLAQLMAGQRRLLHDVSHELRSPLARLNAIVGLARQQPENIEESLSRLERESARMDRLLAELLTLSRLESGLVARFDETVDLGALLGDVVDDAAPEIGQAGFRVDLAAAEGTLVSGDAELLHRLFDNLLRNALIHAARGGWVGIRLSARAGVAMVTVEDRGAGVPDSDLDQLFVAFYRGRSVENLASNGNAANANGHGLGLAIARQIAEQHGGRIKAANRDGGGLCLTVVLPVTKEPD